MSERPALTRGRVLALAWPIMAANVATPLVGVVDVAVVGRTGSAADLAGVALGSLLFNLLYWTAGFLRMGTTGLTAQADGAGDEAAVRAHLGRALLVGAALGAAMLALFWPIREAAFALLSGEAAVEAVGRSYFDARIAGAPAALMGFALYGWLLGVGRSKEALLLQAALNLLNAGLDLLFVLALDRGPAGVAAAAAVSQWVAAGLGGLLVLRILARRRAPAVGERLLSRRALRRLFDVNRDLLLRTLALLAGIAWFNEASLREGTAVLAGNAILLQFISVSAFFLDAFAFVTETVVGRAVGARDVATLRRGLSLTSELAVAFALVLAALLWLGGPAMIEALTTDRTARAAALRYLPWCALVPLVGLPSWQLDGLFIGATRGALMRTAMVVSLGLYLALDAVLRPALGGDGLWLAFLLYYVARAATLAVGYPALERDLRR